MFFLSLFLVFGKVGLRLTVVSEMGVGGWGCEIFGIIIGGYRGCTVFWVLRCVKLAFGFGLVDGVLGAGGG